MCRIAADVPFASSTGSSPDFCKYGFGPHMNVLPMMVQNFTIQQKGVWTERKGFDVNKAGPDGSFVSTGACNLGVPDSNPGRDGSLSSWLCIYIRCSKLFGLPSVAILS